MNVEINEVASTVRAVDGEALLSPRVLAGIVAAVTQAVRDADAHDKRVHAERRITDGVSAEREEER